MPVVASSAYNPTRLVANLVRALVNDANPQVYAQIPILTAARGGNQVTITTSTPHGLLQGDQVVINTVPVGAVGTNFNGQFMVSTIPNSLQFTYAQNGVNETQVGGYCGAIGLGTWASDPLLITHINSSYRKTQRAIANAGGGGFIQDTALIVVSAIPQVDASVQVAITDATAAPNTLPSNLLVPKKIWERPNGTQNDFTEMFDLSQHGGLPSRPQGATLSVWEWRADGIYFLGATQDVQIRLRYSAAFPDLIDGSSPILIRGAQEVLAYGAAASATAARGAPGAQAWDEMYTDALEDVIGANVKQMQSTGRRRRPFRVRNGMTGNRR